MFKSFDGVNAALKQYDSTNLEMAQYVATLLSLPSTVVQQAKSLAAEYAALYNQISMVQYDSDNNIVDVTEKFEGRLSVPESHIASVVQTIGETKSKIEAYVKLLNQFKTTLPQVQNSYVYPALWTSGGRLVNAILSDSGIEFTYADEVSYNFTNRPYCEHSGWNYGLLSSTPPVYKDEKLYIDCAFFSRVSGGTVNFFALCDIIMDARWAGTGPSSAVMMMQQCKLVDFGSTGPDVGVYEFSKVITDHQLANNLGVSGYILTRQVYFITALFAAAVGVWYDTPASLLNVVTNPEYAAVCPLNVDRQVRAVDFDLGDAIKDIMPSTEAIEDAIKAL